MVFCFRRLWQHVTASLREKDIEKATEHKRLLEERQRTEERHRAETETPWRTRYFEREVNTSTNTQGLDLDLFDEKVERDEKKQNS